jgi:enterobacteria phage integrase
MPRKYPPHVNRQLVKSTVYFYFRKAHGKRIALPDYDSPEFGAAYAAALAGDTKPVLKRDAPGTIGALIASYLRSSRYTELRDTTRTTYMNRLEHIRIAHGHRNVAGLTKERIIAMLEAIERPAARLDTLKKLRILIRHAIDLGQLKVDPSVGIKRAKTKEIRAWTDAELDAFRRRWAVGTKQRTAFALMLSVGAARVDVHKITWPQIDERGVTYTRQKTGVAVEVEMTAELRQALEHIPRDHVTVINSELGKPFSITGFSRFMREAINAAGLPPDCKPHGLRKAFGRLLADASNTTHDIMAALGHTTLAGAERYTREADRRRGGRRAVQKLEDHTANKSAQTTSKSLGELAKTKGKSSVDE